jgi:hypothetical protein
MESIARQVVATGGDATEIANRIVEGLAGPGLKLALVFADWRLDGAKIAGIHRGLRVPVVGGSTIGVIGNGLPKDGIQAVGIGFYGDWLRVGLGVAQDLPKAALTRSRDAVAHAAGMLGVSADALDPARHVGITIVDGTCGHEEAFCIGSAAAAPQIRFVGGSAATELGSARRAQIWVNGEVMHDAGAVLLLESDRSFYAVTSSHLVPTDVKTVVTGASGRTIFELDGRPAGQRLRQLVASIGDSLTEPQPSHSFARYVDGLPYVRSMTRIEGEQLNLACAVEVGHVLRLMRPGDLIGTTTRDLAAAAEKVGGDVAACVAFSCIGRHWDAQSRNLDRALAGAYAAYPTVGFQSFGEQSGMLLVNHTLTGLMLGHARRDR